MDEWTAWHNGITFPMPFSPEAVRSEMTHTLVLMPK